MHRRFQTLPLVLAAAALLAPAQAHALRPGGAAAALRECRTGVEPAQRYAIYRADALALGPRKAPTTTRIWVRFDVFDAKGKKLVAEGLNTWIKSDKRVARFTFDKSVLQLPAPGAFRAVVRFRWYRGSKLQKDTLKRTPACVHPDRRPDLVVGGVETTRQDDGQVRYTLGLRNDGDGDAGPFDISLRVGGDELPKQTVSGLGAGARLSVDLVGRACRAKESIEVVIDPDDRVGEADESANVRVVKCPS